MKKVLTIVAGVAVGLVTILVLALAAQWLFFGNTTSINIFNRSNVSLHDFAVVVPGSTFSGPRQEMPPSSDVAFSTDTRMLLPVRITFYADGRHYDVSRRVILPPIGAYIISIYIDPQIQVSIVPRILW